MWTMTSLSGTSAAILMTDLICSTVPGLNTTWVMPISLSSSMSVDGLVEFGDAGADDDAVDRGAGLTGLLHQALSAHLQLPQVRVEEQRVELDGAARLEQLGQLGDARRRRSAR